MNLGSSPRVQGRLTTTGSGPQRHGLIPASAGRTWPMARQRRQERAHPRECGADHYITTDTARYEGSSPRVRGGPGQWLVNAGKNGLIPASAGRTTTSPPTRPATRAHPRECGADNHYKKTFSVEQGSSPRVRGGQPPRGGHDVAGGLIPASAGRTPPIDGSPPGMRAHPRECGADKMPIARIEPGEGSSPRVRGGRPRYCRRLLPVGLIPASAGRTEQLRAADRTEPAHPRECGADSHHRHAL